ncbi:MAG: hypothetical protein QG594_2314 [Bacteroidota bacterium]|nr:hypothetical protein [Bacteroidota bacterium]
MNFLESEAGIFAVFLIVIFGALTTVSIISAAQERKKIASN